MKNSTISINNYLLPGEEFCRILNSTFLIPGGVLVLWKPPEWLGHLGGPGKVRKVKVFMQMQVQLIVLSQIAWYR